MLHRNLLHLFNIFNSHRLILDIGPFILVSDYMQKMNEPFVTFPQINKQKEQEKKKKNKMMPRFEPAPSRFPHKTPSLVHLCNHWDTTGINLNACK